MPRSFLHRPQLVELLLTTAARAAHAGVTGDLHVIGGASLVLKRLRHETKDVDAFASTPELWRVLQDTESDLRAQPRWRKSAGHTCTRLDFAWLVEELAANPEGHFMPLPDATGNPAIRILLPTDAAELALKLNRMEWQDVQDAANLCRVLGIQGAIGLSEHFAHHLAIIPDRQRSQRGRRDASWMQDYWQRIEASWQERSGAGPYYAGLARPTRLRHIRQRRAQPGYSW